MWPPTGLCYQVAEFLIPWETPPPTHHQDWEQVEVTQEVLKTLSSLMDQIPKDQRKAVWQVGWLLLMALKLQHREMLAQDTKIHELQNLEEALEARVCVLEQEVASLGQEGPGELEPGGQCYHWFSGPCLAGVTNCEMASGATSACGARRWSSRAADSF